MCKSHVLFAYLYRWDFLARARFKRIFASCQKRNPLGFRNEAAIASLRARRSPRLRLSQHLFVPQVATS